MIKFARRTMILGIGIGGGFAAGYFKAANDLDREFLHDMRGLGREFVDEMKGAVRKNVQEKRKQTELIRETAEVMRKQAVETEAEEVDFVEFARRAREVGVTKFRVTQLGTGATALVDVMEVLGETKGESPS